MMPFVKLKTNPLELKRKSCDHWHCLAFPTLPGGGGRRGVSKGRGGGRSSNDIRGRGGGGGREGSGGRSLFKGRK